MRVANKAAGYVDYRLYILGVRVWRMHAQLIAKDHEWNTVGAAHPLPITIPATSEELSEAALDVLRLTAWQYEREYPRSDIRAVLLQENEV